MYSWLETRQNVTVSMMFRQQLDQLVEDLNRTLAQVRLTAVHQLQKRSACIQEQTPATSAALSRMETSRLYCGQVHHGYCKRQILQILRGS